MLHEAVKNHKVAIFSILLQLEQNVGLNTCNSLSAGFFMLRGFGAYPGKFCDKSSATALMRARCSSESKLTGNGEDVPSPLADLHTQIKEQRHLQ